MTPSVYLAAVRAVLDHLERTQLPRLDEAAALVAHALAHRGAVFCSELGHGIHGDFINRAGGLAAVQHFSVSVQVNDKTADCLKDRPGAVVDRQREAVRLAVNASQLRANDVMLIGSVSGRNVAPVELALACRDRGVKTIGMTSLAYAARVTPLHPCGRRLHEAVDVAVDIGAPYGDAAVDVPGYAIKLMPLSGVATAVAGWMLWGRVMEKMAAAGTPATVFMSVNRPEGKEFYDKALAEFNRKGY